MSHAMSAEQSIPQSSSPDHPAAHPVQVEGLTKKFGSFAAVDGLDLEVSAGSVHGFLGPNGAGKSTTMRVLLGLYKPSAGRVRVLGKDPATHPAEATRNVSAVPGDVSLWPNLTGRQALDVLAGLRGRYDRTREAGLIERFGLDPSKKIRTYSTGNRQKVMLVAAFAARTDLLLLDEPTAGLDPLMEREFGHCVRQAVDDGRTILLSSHILSEVEELCSSVTIIRDGRLVESGRLAAMRHLAASGIEATVPVERADDIAARLAAYGMAADHDGGAADGVIRVAGSVDRQNVPEVLGTLAASGARDITSVPASLEDLFMRHYEVVS
ncbi:ABC transporter ATP-binding protein [Arthrobacter castelli]|uniref:ABC transporter ATP-binding protein n=1 Tax=Arthrobacter castelli TaxID=271431 RepID=UPI000405BDE4|nr:ABC transporter ATP-binding protein [Arthrobacter castelli]